MQGKTLAEVGWYNVLSVFGLKTNNHEGGSPPHVKVGVLKETKNVDTDEPIILVNWGYASEITVKSGQLAALRPGVLVANGSKLETVNLVPGHIVIYLDMLERGGHYALVRGANEDEYSCALYQYDSGESVLGQRVLGW